MLIPVHMTIAGHFVTTNKIIAGHYESRFMITNKGLRIMVTAILKNESGLLTMNLTPKAVISV